MNSESSWRRFDLMPASLWATALLLCALMGPGSLEAQAPRSSTPGSVEGVVRVETIARGLDHPWGLAFLPDGRMLVTERSGQLRVVAANGPISAPLTGVPEVFGYGQGGLLDVALSPNFPKDRLVYLSFAETGGRGAGTAVARGRFAEDKLEDVRVVWRQQPKLSGRNHFGSRLVFRPDGTLFVTLGERFNHEDQAQDLSNTLGKIVRIDTDGVPPADNPFVGRKNVLPEIWSFGHRNVQAASLHPETGKLWTVEHGPRGGDELNQPEAGRNYGWPVISYGTHYTGFKVGEGTAKAGMEQPVYYWDPVIAPSGMIFYTGDLFPEWKGNILVGSLSPGGLVRLVLQDGKVVHEERYRGKLGRRIRDVQQAPDGSIYLLTDSSNGRILRVTPRAKTPCCAD